MSNDVADEIPGTQLEAGLHNPTARRIISRLRDIGTLCSAQIIEDELSRGDLDQDIDDKRAQHVAQLRAAADFLEANPDLPSLFAEELSIYFWEWMVDNVKEAMTTYRRRIGGLWKKDTDGDLYFKLIGKLGGFPITLVTQRDAVCERRVIGTRTAVTEEVLDPELAKDIPKITVEREIEEVEWICPETLA